MAYLSNDVSPGQDATAQQYNNLREDMIERGGFGAITSISYNSNNSIASIVADGLTYNLTYIGRLLSTVAVSGDTYTIVRVGGRITSITKT